MKTTEEINKTIEEYEYYKSITIGKIQVQYFDEVIERYNNVIQIVDQCYNNRDVGNYEKV